MSSDETESVRRKLGAQFNIAVSVHVATATLKLDIGACVNNVSEVLKRNSCKEILQSL